MVINTTIILATFPISSRTSRPAMRPSGVLLLLQPPLQPHHLPQHARPPRHQGGGSDHTQDKGCR